MDMDKQMLLDLAQMFDDAEREGSFIDEPEGFRTITLIFSDTLANDNAKRLRRIAERM